MLIIAVIGAIWAVRDGSGHHESAMLSFPGRKVVLSTDAIVHKVADIRFSPRPQPSLSDRFRAWLGW